jgi:hypothetical protein
MEEAVLLRIMVAHLRIMAVLPRIMAVVKTSTCNHSTTTGTNMDLPKVMSNNTILPKAEATAAIIKGAEQI